MDYNRNTERWPLGIFDCLTYKVNDEQMCCPDFIPKSVCGTCFVVGEILSRMENEELKFCNMGTKGIACCLISVPINIAGPLGGFCWFASYSLKVRKDVTEKLHIDDGDSCNCCCFDCPTWSRGICYPCSLYQVMMTLREHDAKKNPTMSTHLM